MATTDNGRIPVLNHVGQFRTLPRNTRCTLVGDYMCSYCAGRSAKHDPVYCTSVPGMMESEELLKAPITTVGVLYPSLGTTPSGK